MTSSQMRKLDRELREYFESMVTGMGRLERREALTLYLTGLLLEGERKSTEPMAARLVESAGRTEAMRQRLQQCVSIADWSDAEMRKRLANKLQEQLPGLEALVVDDTGFPKKGTHSVGVTRQYSGTLGRTDNCQVAVSLHLAGEKGSACIGMQLYLSEEWARARKRRAETGIPKEIRFARKWETSLAQIDAALAWGVPHHVVLADAGYGDCREFRDGLTTRGLPYVVRVQGTHKVWPPGATPTQAKKLERTRGRPSTKYSAEGVEPWSIDELATQVPEDEFRRVSWREGSRGMQTSTFAAMRIHTAESRTRGKPPSDEQWLMLEWPSGEPAPTKFYLSSLPSETKLKELVRLAKLRWRVERDYQEMKQEVGLDHFEGRTWRGFHHHATLCMVAHGFLALRRALFPPERDPMDAAHGSPPSSAPAHQADRSLPYVHASSGSPRNSARSLENLIR